MSSTSVTSPISVEMSMVQGLNVFNDPVGVIDTEVQLAERPDIMRRIAITSAGALLAGWYFAGEDFSGIPIVRIVRALLASGLGINVGLMMGNTQLDSVGAAASIYVIAYLYGMLKGESVDYMGLKYEAFGALIAGFAADHIQYMQTQCTCQ